MALNEKSGNPFSDLPHYPDAHPQQYPIAPTPRNGHPLTQSAYPTSPTKEYHSSPYGQPAPAYSNTAPPPPQLTLGPTGNQVSDFYTPGTHSQIPPSPLHKQHFTHYQQPTYDVEQGYSGGPHGGLMGMQTGPPPEKKKKNGIMVCGKKLSKAICCCVCVALVLALIVLVVALVIVFVVIKKKKHDFLN